MALLSVFSGISNVWGKVWPYLVAILLFLFMIFIHEFGHFIAAKLMRVKVNEFSIGFGPTLFKKQGKETLYSVRALPFGGFCAMEGEEELSSDSSAFCNKPAWRRLIIIVAGALFNLMFGFILVMCILMPSDRFTSTTIHSFRENSVSQQSGLEVGDRIVEVGNRSILTTYDLSYCFTNVKSNKIDMVVERDGKEVPLQVEFDTTVKEGMNLVTVDFYVEPIEKTFTSFISQSFKMTVSYAKIVWFSLVDLVTGKYGISAVSGPVGVTAAIGTAARMGLMDLLPMIALITINLGVFNLLPIPALDGGRAFFLAVEMIIRRKIPQKFESLVHAVGLILLLLFMAFITLKDIVGFF